jgi:hypothetical protein
MGIPFGRTITKRRRPLCAAKITWRDRRSIHLRVGETEGLEPLLAFSISVPSEEFAAARTVPAQ